MKSASFILLLIISTVSYSQIKFISLEAGVNNTQLIAKSEEGNSESIGKIGYNFLAKGSLFKEIRTATTIDLSFRFSNYNSNINSNYYPTGNFSTSYLDYNGYIYSIKYDQISFGLGFDRRWDISDKINLISGATIFYNKLVNQRINVSINGNEIDPSNYNLTINDNPIKYEKEFSTILYLGFELNLGKKIYPIINANYEFNQSLFINYTEESYRVSKIELYIGLAYKFEK